MTVSGTTGADDDGRKDGDGEDARGPLNDDLPEDPSAPGVTWREGPVLSAGVEDSDETDADAQADDSEDAFDAPEQLVLGDEEDVRLPWLEAGEEEDVRQGSSAGQLAGLVLLGLVALALIVGVIWWATHRAEDAVLVADGSTIEAPGMPYKEKPKDPGGKTFAGTGDTSFAVSEGQTRPVKLGQQDAAPQPGFATVGQSGAKPGAAVAPDAKGGAEPAETAGVGVQVGAYSSRASAETGWSTLQQRHQALSGFRHRVVEGKADIGTVYRLQAVAQDAAAAKALCGQLRAAGLACQVKN